MIYLFKNNRSCQVVQRYTTQLQTIKNFPVTYDYPFVVLDTLVYLHE